MTFCNGSRGYEFKQDYTERAYYGLALNTFVRLPSVSPLREF